MQMPHRIVVVTSEIPAELDYPTAGGGVRAWNLAAGLRQFGFEVDYALMQPVVEEREVPESYRKHVWTPQSLDSVVAETAPDVLLFCQWQPMSFLKNPPCPVVLDLTGPLLLENWFREDGEIQIQAQTKLRVLAMADAFLVTSAPLKAYFTAWLTMAGVSPEEFPVMDVPVSLPDELPPLEGRSVEDELSFVYSGIFWPWQNPLDALKTLAKVLDERRSGSLTVYGGVHPVHDVPEDALRASENMLDELRKSPRVKIAGMLPYRQLVSEYSRMDVAVDVMEPNIERRLSSPIRSVSYLWAGVPPVVGNYHYLAKDLDCAGAGWSVDPTNHDAMRNLFEWMLDHPGEVRSTKESAQAFAKSKHTWSAALQPLAEFCGSPRYRRKGRHLLDTATRHLEETRFELDRIRASLGDREAALRELQKNYHELEKRFAEEKEGWHRERGQLEARAHSAEADLTAIRSKFIFRVFKKIQNLFAPRE